MIAVAVEHGGVPDIDPNVHQLLGRRPVFRQTRTAFLQHENAKAELKSLVPEDAQEAIGHGLRAKRSKSGAISFDLLALEEHHAALQ